jgi:hypothetical protein
MDDQRRYDLRCIAEQLDKLVVQLNDLADEEEGARNRVGGSPWDYEQMKDAADTISVATVTLHEIGKARANAPARYQV